MGKHHVEEDYNVASEYMSLKDKEKFLDEIGQKELISLFNSWTPKAYNLAKRGQAKSVPLDQKMTLTVTKEDRAIFEKEMKEIRDSGESVSMSVHIRNKALSLPDIHQWKSEAIESLKDIRDTVENKKKIMKRIDSLSFLIDSERDEDIADIYLDEQKKLKKKIAQLKSVPSKRTQRLSGRVTFPESEIIKWRAFRLCLSTSDYLRMMIFDLNPATEADQHMSLVARQRFYIAIGDVAKNGWGNPPTVEECAHCEDLKKKIDELELENSQLRTML